MGTAPINALLEKYRRTQAARQESEARLEEVRGLLAKADERRATCPPNEVRRWNRVLDNLEQGLAEARARFEAANTTLRHLDQQFAANPAAVKALRNLADSVPSDAPAMDESRLATQIENVQAALEASETLYSDLLLASAAETGDTDPVEVPPVGEDPSNAEILKVAITKAIQRKPGQLTLLEAKRLREYHRALSAKAHLSPSEQQLYRILGATLIAVRQQEIL